MTVEEIKEELGIPITRELNFRTDIHNENKLIAWSKTEDTLWMIRISKWALDKLIAYRKDDTVNIDQVVLYNDRTLSETDKGVPFTMVDIDYWKNDPDPDGSLRNQVRAEMFGGYDNGDFGGLYGEEADTARWNCD